MYDSRHRVCPLCHMHGFACAGGRLTALWALHWCHCPPSPLSLILSDLPSAGTLCKRAAASHWVQVMNRNSHPRTYSRN